MGLTGKYLYGYDATTKTQTKVPLYYTPEDCAEWSDIQMKLPAPYTDYGYVYAPANLTSNIANAATAYPGSTNIVDRNMTGTGFDNDDDDPNFIIRPGSGAYGVTNVSWGYGDCGSALVLAESNFVLSQPTRVSYSAKLHFWQSCTAKSDDWCKVWIYFVVDNVSQYEYQYGYTYFTRSHQGETYEFEYPGDTKLLSAGAHSIKFCVAGDASGGDDADFRAYKMSFNVTNHRSKVIPSNIHFTKGSQEYVFLSGRET